MDCPVKPGNDAGKRGKNRHHAAIPGGSPPWLP